MMKFYKKILAAFLAMLCAVAVNATDVETLYGYCVYSWNMTRLGFVSFSVDDISNVTMHKSAKTIYSPHLSAGEYLDGKIYAFTFQPEDDYTGDQPSFSYDIYDGDTYELLSRTDKTDCQRVIDMTYDYTTNTMYAIAEDEVSASSNTGRTSLCIVDLATGNLTWVGYAGDLKAIDGYKREVETTLVTLAADMEGNLYAMSDLRQFYKIDKFSGKATQIGTQHKLAVNNEFQSMTFGHDGVLYWTQKTPDYGWLSTIDPTTGVPTYIGKLGENDEVTALHVKRQLTKAFPQAVADLKAVNDATEHNKVSLTWTLPTKDYAGNDTQLTEVRVYRLGTSEPLAVLPADATSYVDENSDNGMNYYEVVAVNTTAPGTPATVGIFAGYDQLKGVNNLQISLDDKTVSLSWSKPTETVNGQYADYDNITYNVYRVVSEGYTKVSDNQTGTTFTETLSKPGAYIYVVEAVSGGVVGLGAASETIVVQAQMSIPYTTGFENDGDAALWTFYNNHANTSYGWSITAGYSSQRLDGNYAQLKSYGSSEPTDDWMISPAIKFDKGTYTLKYYVNGGSFDTHSWEIFLGIRNTDTSTFTQSIDRHEEELINGWDNVIEKTFTIDRAGIYYIGFHGFTKCTYATLKIDNFSIEEGTSGINDLAANQRGIRFDGTNAVIAAEKPIATWSVFNLQGQKVMQGSGDGSASVKANLSSLPHGIYMVNAVLNNGEQFSIKINK